MERHTFGLGYHPSGSESAAGKKMVQYMDRICTIAGDGMTLNVQLTESSAGAYPTATIARVQQKEPTSSLFAQLYRPAPAEDVESGNYFLGHHFDSGEEAVPMRIVISDPLLSPADTAVQFRLHLVDRCNKPLRCSTELLAHLDPCRANHDVGCW